MTLKVRSWVRFSTAGLAYGAFLSAGYFKADARLDWIPVDLTLVLGLLTIGLTFVRILRDGFSVPRATGWLYGLYILLLVPVLWTDWDLYSSEKVLKLFTLTVVITFAPLILFRSDEEVRRLLNSLTLIGTLMALDATWTLLVVEAGVQRLTAFGSNGIGLGRSVGVPLVWIGLLFLEKRLPSRVSLPLLGVLSIVLIGAGSRGPLVAAVGSIAVSGCLFYWKKPSVVGRFLAIAAIVSGMLIIGLRVAPADSTQRIQRFFSGELGASELRRLEAYQASWEVIQDHPFGVGWGGFVREVNLWNGQERQYPHNIAIEIVMEGGWLLGAYFLILVMGTWMTFRRTAHTVERRALLGLFLFALVNSMVSGDINDNKLLFACMGIAAGFRSSPPLENRTGNPGTGEGSIQFTVVKS